MKIFMAILHQAYIPILLSEIFFHFIKINKRLYIWKRYRTIMGFLIPIFSEVFKKDIWLLFVILTLKKSSFYLRF